MPEAPRTAELIRISREVLAPLIAADGGELYLVSANDEEIALHLSGACAGCPGAPLTTAKIIEPLLFEQAEGHRVVVTAGAIIPTGAKKLNDALELTFGA